VTSSVSESMNNCSGSSAIAMRAADCWKRRALAAGRNIAIPPSACL
jgi:hypothetical protein